MTARTYGSILRTVRERAGLSVADMATLIDIAPATVERVEAGTLPPWPDASTCRLMLRFPVRDDRELLTLAARERDSVAGRVVAALERIGLWPFDGLARERLREAVDEAGLALLHMPEVAGISPGTLDEWLAGAGDPDPVALLALASALEGRVHTSLGVEWLRRPVVARRDSKPDKELLRDSAARAVVEAVMGASATLHRAGLRLTGLVLDEPSLARVGEAMGVLGYGGTVAILGETPNRSATAVETVLRQLVASGSANAVIDAVLDLVDRVRYIADWGDEGGDPQTAAVLALREFRERISDIPVEHTEQRLAELVRELYRRVTEAAR